jgi:hypothetical protein
MVSQFANGSRKVRHLLSKEDRIFRFSSSGLSFPRGFSFHRHLRQFPPPGRLEMGRGASTWPRQCRSVDVASHFQMERTVMPPIPIPTPSQPEKRTCPRNKTIDRMTPRIIGPNREMGKTIWGFNDSSDLWSPKPSPPKENSPNDSRLEPLNHLLHNLAKTRGVVLPLLGGEGRGEDGRSTIFGFMVRCAFN